MRDPKRRAISNACCWMNRCYDLGVTAEELIAASTASRLTASRKEKEKGKEETSPHTPLKEKREKEEKAAAAAAARVRVCACVREAEHPTLAQVENFATTLGATPEFARQWYDQMDRILNWRHPKDGKRIKNWQRNLQLWWKRREDFDPPEPAPAPQVPQIDFKALEDL